MKVKYENGCVNCPGGCIHCGRDKQAYIECDECGDDAQYVVDDCSDAVALCQNCYADYLRNKLVNEVKYLNLDDIQEILTSFCGYTIENVDEMDI